MTRSRSNIPLKSTRIHCPEPWRAACDMPAARGKKRRRVVGQAHGMGRTAEALPIAKYARIFSWPAAADGKTADSVSVFFTLPRLPVVSLLSGRGVSAAQPWRAARDARGRSSIFDISLENSPDRLRTKCLQRRDDGRSPALSTGCARRKHCPCGSGRLRNKLLASAAQLFPPVCMRSACGKSPGREWKSRDHSRFQGAERARRKRAPDGKQRGMSRHTRIFIFAAAPVRDHARVKSARRF